MIIIGVNLMIVYNFDITIMIVVGSDDPNVVIVFSAVTAAWWGIPVAHNILCADNTPEPIRTITVVVNSDVITCKPN